METDLLTSNGVIHVVNGVMLDTNSNPAAASSALAILFILFVITRSSHDTSFASATSVAASTVESGPVTSPTPSLHGGAMKGGANNWKLGALVGMVVGFGRFV